jgi:hypothetical protein
MDDHRGDVAEAVVGQSEQQQRGVGGNGDGHGFAQGEALRRLPAEAGQMAQGERFQAFPLLR